MSISYIKGDLFSATESLAHCISADAKLGKGIALIFKKKFGDIDKILAQKQKPGGCAVLEKEGRFIYNLVTKERYFDKPTYPNVESSLQKMHKHCVANDVKCIAMPRIACGLDGLDWFRVCKLINQTFSSSGISIKVYDLDKDPKTTKGSKRKYKQQTTLDFKKGTSDSLLS